MPPTQQDPLDLAEGIVGKFVDEHTPTIKWKSGHTTILPFLPDDKGKNKLWQDEYFVRRLVAITDVPGPESALVKSLDRSDPDLRSQFATALDAGKSVLVRNAEDVSHFELTAEHMEENYGLPAGMQVDYHGAHFSP